MEPYRGKMLDKEFACVLTLHRDDLVSVGVSEECAALVKDDILEEIASKLGKAILDTSYWDCLKTITTEGMVPMLCKWIYRVHFSGGADGWLNQKGDVITREDAISAAFIGTREEAGVEEYRRLDLHDLGRRLATNKNLEITAVITEKIP